MSPYLGISIVFGILMCLAWFITKLPTTIYLPVTEGVQEDVETRKKKAQKIRSKRFVYGVGGVFVLCLLSYAMVALATPAQKVYGALWPSRRPRRPTHPRQPSRLAPPPLRLIQPRQRRRSAPRPPAWQHSSSRAGRPAVAG